MSDPSPWIRTPLARRFVRGLAALVGLIVGLIVGLLGGGACGTADRDAPSAPLREAARVEAAEREVPASPAPPAPPPSVMVGVVERAIVPPPEGSRTYRVDAYVAVLVVEHLRRSALPFVSWRADEPEPGGPSAGYRVGTLAADGPWARLGLREGDIIAAVNGVSTADAGWAERALERSEHQVTVSIVRDGVSFVSSYRLVGGLAWSDQRPATSVGSATGSDVDPDTSDTSDTPDTSATPETPPASGERASGSRGGSAGSRGAPPRGSPDPRRSPDAGGGGGSTPRPGAVARCSSASRCTLDQAYFNRMTRSPAKLQSQADVVPAIRDNVFSGYRLKSVRSGTAVHQLGFRAGDTITHINGRDLTNDFQAMQVYLGLSSTRTFRVRYVRGGSARTKTITVE